MDSGTFSTQSFLSYLRQDQTKGNIEYCGYHSGGKAGSRKSSTRSSTPPRDRKEMAEVVFCLWAEPDILDPPHRQHHERIQSFNKLIEGRLYLFAIANDFVHHLGRDRTFCRPLSCRQY